MKVRKRGIVLVFVVLFVLLLVHFSQSQTSGAGCFTLPSYVSSNNGQCGSGVTETIAENNCQSHPTLSKDECMARYYFDGLSCPTSGAGICNTNRLGWCTDSCQQGPNIQAACQDRSSFVLQTAKPNECKAGCCVCVSTGTAPNVCENLIMDDCEKKCGTQLTGYRFGELNMSINEATCEQTGTGSYCLGYTFIPSNLTGYVLNDGGSPISDATVKVYDKSDDTDTNGKYSIIGTAAGFLIVETTSPNYAKSISTVNVGAGNEVEYNITLMNLSQGKFKGTVSDNNGALSGVLISANGPTYSQAFTNNTGKYVLENLPFGSYTVKAQKTAYQTGTKTENLNQSNTPKQVDFTLSQQLVGGISGTVTDKDGPIASALIYVDNVYKTSTGTFGTYSISVDAVGKTYKVKASKVDYTTVEKTSINFTSSGQSDTIDFRLNSTKPECAFPANKPVTVFTASHVLGEEAVKLTWQRPCLEVTGYYINRTEGTTETFVDYVDIVSPGQTLEYIDDGVEWGKTYRYEIQAAYADTHFRFSTPKDANITLGDVNCEGRYVNNDWVEFCQLGRLRMKCINTNQVQQIFNCTQYQNYGSNGFCYGPDITGTTSCREVRCSTSVTEDPNIWRARCLSSTTFCYWDTVQQNTGCWDCRGITTCNQYKTQNACGASECFNANCSWVQVPNTATGYACYEIGANDTSHCSDCSDFNQGCTANVCTQLGKCYASQGNIQCLACGSTSRCDTYYSQLECEGGQEVDVGNDYNIITSNDVCGLGTCDWVPTTSTQGVCRKDGDNNNVNDCAPTDGNCLLDNDPPVTTLEPLGFIGVNKNQGQVTFKGSETTMKDLTYCISQYNNCRPNVTINYSGSQLQLNLATTDALTKAYTGNKGKYYIRFYSRDQRNNRERELKSRSFYVDIDEPNIVISQNLSLNPSGSTLFLDVLLVPSEKAECTDKLTMYGTNFQAFKIQNEINSSWKISYTNLADGLYKYNVTCEDEVGNKGSSAINIIDVDAIKAITVEVPQPAIKTTSFKFKVRTNDSSNCVLYNGSTSIGTLPSQNNAGFVHESPSMSTFAANQLYTGWNVKCTNRNTQVQDDAQMPFAIDFLAPDTEIILSSSDDVVRRFTTDGWYAFFNEDVTVNFNCLKRPNGGGFDCGDTKWCSVNTLSGNCTPTQTSTSTSVTGTFVIKKICYYSEDLGNNIEAKKCGIVVVSPFFGIQVIEPSFGVSNTKPFDLKIDSGVPSNLCKWSIGPDFDFGTLSAGSNIFTPANDNLVHTISSFSNQKSFPLNITIKCNSTDGRISPPEFFEIDYDSSPPRILSASPSQSVVEGGDRVDLIAMTDDRTRCKYDSQNIGFGSMRYKFGNSDEFDLGIFKTTNRKTIILSANDDNKTHTYYVICQNRAENVSTAKTITFRVDFSTQGTITSTRPTGSVKDTAITIGLTTNKAAQCEYRVGTAYSYFDSTGTRNHNQLLSNLTEGQKSFPVRCTIAEGPTTGARVTGSISFIVDRTAPTMVEIEDGNHSCSLVEIYPEFEANDTVSAIDEYYYEVYKTNSATPMAAANTTSENPEISGLNLSEGSSYYLKVKAKDAAGNWATAFEESDGFTARASNYSACQEQSNPSLTFETEPTSTGVSVEINCHDNIGCTQVKYGTALTASDCSATITYTSAFVLTATKYVCAEGYDSSNNKGEKIERVFIDDEDVDGVGDDYDLCPDTPHGAVVDENGCSDVQKNVDTDGDQLPDWWELKYDDTSCPLDIHEADTDADGIDDNENDYDDDGLTNYQEYQEEGHPCLLTDSDGDGVPDNIDECPGTETGDTVDEVGCALAQTITCEDGIDDAWRIRYFASILCTGEGAPSADPDNDDLTNTQEYSFKTNPTLADTDGDGYSDSKEVSEGWDPLDPFSPAEKKSNFLPIFLLILGNILVWGGVIFLVVQILIPKLRKAKMRRPTVPITPVPGRPTVRVAPRPVPRPVVRVPPRPLRPRPEVSLAREKLRERIAKRKAEREETMTKRRKEVFGVFGGEEKLPEMEKIVKKDKKSVVEKLTDLTHHYLTKKPKLKTHEKKVFEELAKRIKKPNKTEIRKVLKTKSKGELHGVFNKLLDMIGKRSGKKDVFEKLKKYEKKK